MTIGVMVDGKIVQRPYSVASPPVVGRHGRLRVLRPPRPGRDVHAAAVADADRPRDADDRAEGQVRPRARRRPDPRLHLVGHRQCAVRLDDAPAPGRRAVLARPSSSTACRTPHELGYRDIVEDWERTAATIRSPTSRRSPGRTTRANATWPGRTGRVESILGPVLDELGLDADNSIAYICGNPDMILSAEETLLERGYPEDAGPQGALLAEGQGTARRGGRRPRRGDRRRRGERRPVARLPYVAAGAGAGDAADPTTCQCRWCATGRPGSDRPTYQRRWLVVPMDLGSARLPCHRPPAHHSRWYSALGPRFVVRRTAGR